MIASSNDSQLLAQGGYEPEADGFLAAARNFVRFGLVLTAWRTAIPPDPDVEKRSNQPALS